MMVQLQLFVAVHELRYFMIGCVEHFPMIPHSIDPIEKPDARDVD